MAHDDRHSYAMLTRFLDATALTHCEVIDAAPRRPLIPQLAPLAQTIDSQLDGLWGGESTGGI
jgi:hypothetical protein